MHACIIWLSIYIWHYTNFMLAGLTALYRYWNPHSKDHFYTTNINEIGMAFKGLTGRHRYKSEGIQCLLYTRQVKGSTPLYRYWKGSVGDHFYTINPDQEIATTTPGHKGWFGYVSEGIASYCFPHAVAGTVPLYHYWQGKSILITSIHACTTSGGEIGTTIHGLVGRFGYHSEGVGCHVIPYYDWAQQCIRLNWRVILTQFGLPQLHAYVTKQFKPQLCQGYLKPGQLLARA